MIAARRTRAIVVIAAAFALAACASPEANTVHTDVHCTVDRQVPIVVGSSVYLVDSGCRAWTTGPTPRERDAFERAHPKQGGAQ
jgi:uncharacterized lipoprotein YajG